MVQVRLLYVIVKMPMNSTSHVGLGEPTSIVYLSQMGRKVTFVSLEYFNKSE